MTGYDDFCSLTRMWVPPAKPAFIVQSHLLLSRWWWAAVLNWDKISGEDAPTVLSSHRFCLQSVIGMISPRWSCMDRGFNVWSIHNKPEFVECGGSDPDRVKALTVVPNIRWCLFWDMPLNYPTEMWLHKHFEPEISGSFSGWKEVTNGVPQDVQLFTIYINNLEEETGYKVFKFAVGTKTYGRAYCCN